MTVKQKILRTKECKTCGADKPLNEYNSHVNSDNGKDYFSSNCRACMSIARREYSENPRPINKKAPEKRNYYIIKILRRNGSFEVHKVHADKIKKGKPAAAYCNAKTLRKSCETMPEAKREKEKLFN